MTRRIHFRDPALDQAIVDNFIGSWADFTEPLGVTAPLLEGRVGHFLTGLPIMMYNCLFDGSITDADEVGEVVSHFKERRLPMMWFVGPGAAPELPAALDQHLEEARMKVPGMALDLDTLERSALVLPGDGPIAIVSADQDPDEYFRIFLEGFELDLDDRSQLTAFARHYFEYERAQHFIGYLEGEPAAIATYIDHSGVAGVYDVVTRHDFRGRGLGRAMMNRVLRAGIEDGHRAAILHSTEMGYPLYRSLGFEDRFTFRRFLLRPTAF